MIIFIQKKHVKILTIKIFTVYTKKTVLFSSNNNTAHDLIKQM